MKHKIKKNKTETKGTGIGLSKIHANEGEDLNSEVVVGLA